MTSCSGVDIRSSKLRCLQPVLREWILLNGRLAKRWLAIPDVPWWYRERALLSIYSGALWLSGGVVLEEYSDDKRILSKGGRILPRSFKGRVDLYFETSPAKTFTAEAKHIWLHASNHRSQKARLKECLRHACSDIRKLKGSGTRRLAIVFATPYVTFMREDGLDDHVHWVLDQVRSVPADAVAWTFPSLGKYGRFRRDKTISPGIAMLIKEVQK